MGNRIEELRLRRGLTLLQVAKAVGVAESTISRYEGGGISSIKYEVVTNLANLFDVSPAYLMGWSDDDYSPEERLLVYRYQNMNKYGQQKLMEYSHDLLGNPQYKKCNSTGNAEDERVEEVI